MKNRLLRHELTSPTFYWAIIVLVVTAFAADSLQRWADYQPSEVNWVWLIGGPLAGASALLGLAPPFVVRAQVRFENERSVANFRDVPIVFEEARVLRGLLSEVVARRRYHGGRS